MSFRPHQCGGTLSIVLFSLSLITVVSIIGSPFVVHVAEAAVIRTHSMSSQQSKSLTLSSQWSLSESLTPKTLTFSPSDEPTSEASLSDSLSNTTDSTSSVSSSVSRSPSDTPTNATSASRSKSLSGQQRSQSPSDSESPAASRSQSGTSSQTRHSRSEAVTVSSSLSQEAQSQSRSASPSPSPTLSMIELSISLSMSRSPSESASLKDTPSASDVDSSSLSQSLTASRKTRDASGSFSSSASRSGNTPSPSPSSSLTISQAQSSTMASMTATSSGSATFSSSSEQSASHPSLSFSVSLSPSGSRNSPSKEMTPSRSQTGTRQRRGLSSTKRHSHSSSISASQLLSTSWSASFTAAMNSASYSHTLGKPTLSPLFSFTMTRKTRSKTNTPRITVSLSPDGRSKSRTVSTTDSVSEEGTETFHSPSLTRRTATTDLSTSASREKSETASYSELRRSSSDSPSDSSTQSPTDSESSSPSSSQEATASSTLRSTFSLTPSKEGSPTKSASLPASTSISFSQAASQSILSPTKSWTSSISKNSSSPSATHLTPTRDRRQVSPTRAVVSRSSSYPFSRSSTVSNERPTSSRTISKSQSRELSSSRTITISIRTVTPRVTKGSSTSSLSRSATDDTSASYSVSSSFSPVRSLSRSASRSSSASVSPSKSPSPSPTDHTVSEGETESKSLSSSASKTREVSGSWSASFSRDPTQTPRTLSQSASTTLAEATITRAHFTPTPTESEIGSDSFSQSNTQSVTVTPRSWSVELSASPSSSQSSTSSVSEGASATRSHTSLRSASLPILPTKSGTESQSLGTITGQISMEITQTVTLYSKTRTVLSPTRNSNTRTSTQYMSETATRTEEESVSRSGTITLLISESATQRVTLSRTRRSPTLSSTASTTDEITMTRSASKATVSSALTVTRATITLTQESSGSSSIGITGTRPSITLSTSARLSDTINRRSKSPTEVRSVSKSWTLSWSQSVSSSVSVTDSSDPSQSESGSRSSSLTEERRTPSKSQRFSPSASLGVSLTKYTASPSAEPTRRTYSPSSFPSGSHSFSVSDSSSPTDSSSVTITMTDTKEQSATTTGSISDASYSKERTLKTVTVSRGHSKSKRISPSKSEEESETATLLITRTATSSGTVTGTSTLTLAPTLEWTASRTDNQTRTGTLTLTVSTTVRLIATHSVTISGDLSASKSLTATATSPIDTVTRMWNGTLSSTEYVSATVTETVSSSETVSGIHTMSLTAHSTPTIGDGAKVSKSMTLTLSDEKSRSTTWTATVTKPRRLRWHGGSSSQSLTTATRSFTEAFASQSATMIWSRQTGSLSTTLSVGLTVTRLGNSTSQTDTAARTSTQSYSQQWSSSPSNSVTFSATMQWTGTRQKSRTLLQSLSVRTITVTLSLSISGQASRSSTTTPTKTTTLRRRRFSVSASEHISSTVSEKRTRTSQLSLTRRSGTMSPSGSQQVSETLSRRQRTRTDTGTDDVTLTQTASRSVMTKARTESETVTVTVTQPSRSLSETVLTYLAAVAELKNPSVPTVRENVTIAVRNAPSSHADGDAMFIVLRSAASSETRSNNSCALHVLNSTNFTSAALSYVATSTIVVDNISQRVITFNGTTAVVGYYDVCFYSAVRQNWYWWDVNLTVGPKFRQGFLLPRGRLAVSDKLRLTVGVWGALASDHMVLVLRSQVLRSGGRCPFNSTAQMESASSSGIYGPLWVFSASPVSGNATFSAIGQVAAAGDYTICYFGFPYREYRIAQSPVRVVGVPKSLSSAVLTQANATTAVQAFNITIAGSGLSVFDNLVVANGSSCERLKIASSLLRVRCLTSPTSASFETALTRLDYEVRILFPMDVATICFKSNFSTYFSAMRSIAVLDNVANYSSPHSDSEPLVYAQGSVLVHTFFPAPSATLNADTDVAVLCFGRWTHCGCTELTDVQRYTPQNSSIAGTTLFALSGVRLRSSAALVEYWSLCYLTRSMRPYNVAPLDVVELHRYVTVPQLLPPTPAATGLTVQILSFNATSTLVAALFRNGSAGNGCPLDLALPPTDGTVSLQFAIVNGTTQVFARILPLKVLPMTLCVRDTSNNVTYLSSTLVVTASPPNGFFPNRFVVNQSTAVTFFPSDGSTFNFLTTAATVVPCVAQQNTSKNGTSAFVQAPNLVVEKTVNATTLSLRFLNITAKEITSNALCYFDVSNGTLLPIPQASPFAVTSQVIRSTFVSAVGSAAPKIGTLGPLNIVPVQSSLNQNTSITVSVEGISLYDGDLALVSCSGNPSTAFRQLSHTIATAWNLQHSESYDVTTSVWRISGTTAGNVSLCAVFGAARTTGVAAPLRDSLSSPMFVVFDSVLVTAQQMPSAPHSVVLDHSNAYWLVGSSVADLSPRFAQVRIVQKVAGSDNPCNERSLDLAADSSAANDTSVISTLWRYRANDLYFVRGNVSLCYTSVSGAWYSFLGSSSSFFMQAALPSLPLQYYDSSSGDASVAFAACRTKVTVSGFQLDATADIFYYHYASSSTSSTSNGCELYNASNGNLTRLSIASVTRDMSNLGALANISLQVAANRIGTIVMCVSLSQSTSASTAAPLQIGLIPLGNPITLSFDPSNVTSSANISMRCSSDAVGSAPSAVVFNYSLLLPNATGWLPLDASVPQPSLALGMAPLAPFTVRYTAILAATGAALLTLDSAAVTTNRAPTDVRGRLQLCSTFNSSAIAKQPVSTRSTFAQHIIFVSNFVAAGCGSFIADGTLNATNSAQGSITSLKELTTADTSLIWDKSAFLSLLTAAVSTSLPVVSPGGGQQQQQASITEATATFSTLMSLSDPKSEAALPGANISAILSTTLSLISSVSDFVAGTQNSASSSTLAPAVMETLSTLSAIACSSGSSGTAGSSSSYQGKSLRMSSVTPLTRSSPAALVVGKFSISIPAAPLSASENATISNNSTSNTTASTVPSNCFTAVTLPNVLPQSSSAQLSLMQRKLFSTTSSVTTMPFNITTIAIFSSSPITTASLMIDASGKDRVDLFDGYRYYSASASSFNSGGTWALLPTPQVAFSFNPSQSLLAVNLTNTTASGNYFIFSGVTTPVYPDAVLQRRVSAQQSVCNSIYWILLALILLHVTGVVSAVLWDRFAASKRYLATSELLFGVPTPIPTVREQHKYLSLLTLNIVSLTEVQLLEIQREAHKDSGEAGGSVMSHAAPATLHPTAVVATSSKVHVIMMHGYVMLMATVFVNRQNVAEQIPTLFQDFVLMGASAALLSRPIVSWARVALMRCSQDWASLASSCASLVAILIAGGVSGLSLKSTFTVFILVGLFIHGVVVVRFHNRRRDIEGFAEELKQRRQQARNSPLASIEDAQDNVKQQRLLDAPIIWSLHHYIDVPVVVQVVGYSSLLVCVVLTITLLFFVPYFNDGKLVILGYDPKLGAKSRFAYFGNKDIDPYTLPVDAFIPDSTNVWKSFLLAVSFDAALVETLIVVWHWGVMVGYKWWRSNGSGGLRNLLKKQWWTERQPSTAPQGEVDRRLPPTTLPRSFLPAKPSRFQPDPSGGELEEARSVDSGFIDMFNSPLSRAASEASDSFVKDKRLRSITSRGSLASPSEAMPNTMFSMDRRNSGLIEEVTDGEDEDEAFVSVPRAPGEITITDPFGSIRRVQSVYDRRAVDNDPYESQGTPLMASLRRSSLAPPTRSSRNDDVLDSIWDRNGDSGQANPLDEGDLWRDRSRERERPRRLNASSTYRLDAASPSSYRTWGSSPPNASVAHSRAPTDEYDYLDSQQTRRES